MNAKIKSLPPDPHHPLGSHVAYLEGSDKPILQCDSLQRLVTYLDDLDIQWELQEEAR